jgi:hypothetical protein
MTESGASHYSDDCPGDHERRRAGDGNESIGRTGKVVNEQVVGPMNDINMQMEGKGARYMDKRSSSLEQLDGEKSATS